MLEGWRSNPNRRNLVVLRAGRSVFLALFGLTLLVGQTDSSIVGIITSKDGKPVDGIKIYSWTSCCPRKGDEATTDENGQFRIEHPGAVLHVLNDKFEPSTYVVGTKKAVIRIVLEPATNNLTVPVCGKVQPNQQRIGWGNYGLRFNVIKHDVQVHGGKPDVDYVRYVIKRKHGVAHLELWFGLNAIDAMPEDAEFIKSETFEQRNVVNSDGRVSGFDSWGQGRGGGNWRYTSVLGEGGSIYENASREEASLFDHIVNSVCEVPYPNRRL
jgi:hypothetical protein